MRWIFLLLLWFLPATAQAQIITGPATALDGATLDFGGMHVRLLGIDAPESTQTCKRDEAAWACGQEAKAALARMIADRPVECEQQGRDAEGRIVALCKVGGNDLSDALARAGMAVALPEVTDAYAEAQARAKTHRLGLWGSTFQFPAEFRAADPAFRKRAEQRRRVQRAAAIDTSAVTRRAVPGGLYFRGCNEARAAGAAPLYRGQPGYRAEMDGDHDGIACEPPRGR